MTFTGNSSSNTFMLQGKNSAFFLTICSLYKLESVSTNYNGRKGNNSEIHSYFRNLQLLVTRNFLWTPHKLGIQVKSQASRSVGSNFGPPESESGVVYDWGNSSLEPTKFLSVLILGFENCPAQPPHFMDLMFHDDPILYITVFSKIRLWTSDIN